MKSKLVTLAAFITHAVAQIPLWGQFTLLFMLLQGGGWGWTGSTNCVVGSTCVKFNKIYSQCLPSSTETGGNTSTSIAVPTISNTLSETSPTTSNIPSTTISQPSSACSTSPNNPPLPTNSRLPDPFIPLNGSRITTKDAWTCPRNEIGSLLQKLELGVLPPKPSSITATFSSNRLNINCSEGGKSILFSVSITYPTSGKAPYPAIIAYGGDHTPRAGGIGNALVEEGAAVGRRWGEFETIRWRESGPTW
ncbi:hypothetical protein CPB86DRAFT_799744 [Serendipita vermifera]|nr:hypothetical protein CPB86DRAFT_799744 [Serendipita vermifera]